VVGAVREHVFQLGQPVQMDFQLRVTPAGKVAQVAPREAYVAALDLFRRALRRDHFFDEGQEPPRLRRHFIEGAPEHFVREAVRRRDVVERGLDVVE
jgi:hypothetical protein